MRAGSDARSRFGRRPRRIPSLKSFLIRFRLVGYTKRKMKTALYPLCPGEGPPGHGFLRSVKMKLNKLTAFSSRGDIRR